MTEEKKNPCESGNYDDVLECAIGEVDEDADYITLEFDDGVDEKPIIDRGCP